MMHHDPEALQLYTDVISPLLMHSRKQPFISKGRWFQEGTELNTKSNPFNENWEQRSGTYSHFSPSTAKLAVHSCTHTPTTPESTATPGMHIRKQAE